MRTTKEILIKRRQAPATRSESRPSFLVLFLIGIFPLLLVELVPLPVLRSFEWTVYDAEMRLRNSLAPRKIDDRIIVVGVSEADEERLDADLKNRQSYLALLARLREWGAQLATFDIFFADEKGTDSLFADTLTRDRPPSVLAYHFRTVAPAYKPTGDPPSEMVDSLAMAATGKDIDAVRQAVLQFDDYLLQLRDMSGVQEFSPADLEQYHRNIAWAREIRGDLLRRWFWLTQGVEFVIPATARPYEARDVGLLTPRVMLSARALGFANVEKDEEDVVRSVPLVYSYQGRLFPNLSLAAALVHYGAAFSEVEISWGNELRFPRHAHGEGMMRIPIDERGRYLVNFREGESYLRRCPTLSAVVLPQFSQDAFDGKAPQRFQDALVIMGEVISGGSATDLEPIPLQAQFPMVGMHANVLDNILHSDYLVRAPFLVRFLIVLLLGTAMALVYLRFPFAAASRLSILLVLGYGAAQFLLTQMAGYNLSLVKPVVGMGFAVFGFFGYLIVIKDRDRRLVRDVFLRSVSPRIGEEILKNYHDDAIWGARRTITVLFIDIRGYTTMSERHGADVVLGLLDRFYDTVSESVFRHEGQVNKFLGDAVLALFGALPEEAANHAERALRAAAEIQGEMKRLNETEFGRDLGVSIETGAGVNTGDATVGLVGRRRIRIEYTALGDAVNIASRLQGLASEGEVMIGETTLASLGEHHEDILNRIGLRLGEREMLTVKGKRDPIPSFRARITEEIQRRG